MRLKKPPFSPSFSPHPPPLHSVPARPPSTLRPPPPFSPPLPILPIPPSYSFITKAAKARTHVLRVTPFPGPQADIILLSFLLSSLLFISSFFAFKSLDHRPVRSFSTWVSTTFLPVFSFSPFLDRGTSLSGYAEK